jgi:hypothetical protein
VKRLAGAAAVAAAAALAVPAASPAATRVVTMKGVHAAGPARYDRVRVVEMGPRTARHVLVLEPGTSAGAGYFVPLARDLVRRLPGWQVWSVDRRENLLEDHSALDRARAGRASGAKLFDYYLDWIGNASATHHYQPPADADLGFARRWGMRVAVGDLHRVIAAARRGGREVVLGGHSLGGSIATAYATWDFGGHAGARDLGGLLLIDGASNGPAPKPHDARAQLRALRTGSPFLDLTGTGLPWATGVFAAVGSTLALREPGAPSRLQAWPLLPAELKPPVPATNAASFGYVLDTDTGPPNLTLVQAHLGRLRSSGDPRGFRDGGYATVRRAAQALSGIRGADGTAWFHPRRLSLDASAVAGGVRNRAQRVLGVHATHGRDVHVPIYAIETSLGAGRVLRAARALARRSHLPRRELRLVDRHVKYAHCDPVFDAPGHNDLIRTAVPFLERLE